MTLKEARIKQALLRNVDNYDRSNHADAPLVAPTSGRPAVRLGSAWGNPSFTAQFDISIILKYFTVAAGAFTLRTAAYVLANAAALATQLPAFIFGNTDYAAGFAKLQTQYALSGGWAYSEPFVYGKDYPAVRIAASTYVAIDANVQAVLVKGDLVIPVWATVAGPVTYVGIVIVRCAQVGYGTLLNALSSDKFAMNMLRYVLGNTDVTQYQNAIGVYRQTLFGKFDSDTVSPASFKQPDQQQTNIIDMPIEKGIDKSISLASFINYDAATITWSFFVQSVDKLSY